MRRELVLWEGCAYALAGIGAPSRLSVIRKAAALASTRKEKARQLAMHATGSASNHGHERNASVVSIVGLVLANF